MSVNDETWDKCGYCLKTKKSWHYYHGRDGCMIHSPIKLKNIIKHEEAWLKNTLEDAKEAKTHWPTWANNYCEIDNFDEWFMNFVYLAARKSKDPKTKIGAVLVHNNEPVAICYNGFPKGVKDNPDRYNDRELKRKMVCHAEENTTYLAAKRGVSTVGSTLYTQGIPCSECTKGLINAEISKIIVHKQWPNLIHSPEWVNSIELSKLMLNEAGIIIECLDKILGTKGFLDGKVIEV
jgi:dCMP deaminase